MNTKVSAAMAKGTNEQDAGRRQIGKTDQTDGTMKKKTMRQKQDIQASGTRAVCRHCCFIISALCSVASADPAEMMQIISLLQIDINGRPSKYSQFAPESTGGLAHRAFTDKITVLCTSFCLHHSSTGRWSASFLQDPSCP